MPVLSVRAPFPHQTKGREFLLRVAYMEIYNEVIQDLLNPKPTNLKIHEDPEQGVFVGDLREEVVMNPRQVLDLMVQGEGMHGILSVLWRLFFFLPSIHHTPIPRSIHPVPRAPACGRHQHE